MDAHANRTGPWFLTASGRRFFPADPQPEDICVSDIAHALSHVCRFGGHCREFYCPTPEQRVLTADLRWVPAGDLRVGDGLLAFDEKPHELGSCGKRRRRFRPSTVTALQHVKRRIVRLEMADGSTVRSSAEHPWLVATKASRNQTWLPAASIAAAVRDGRTRYMHHFIEPWTFNAERDAGWLAGMSDGEGSLAVVERQGTQLAAVSQRRGRVLDECERLIARYGYEASVSRNGHRDVFSVQLRGGWRSVLRYLGSVRPLRLLATFQRALAAGAFNKQLDGVHAPIRVVKAYEEGLQWVTGLATSSSTYFCEGFGAHNSVAQHAVLVSRLVPAEHAWLALHHDDAEAYTGDMVRPFKLLLPDFKRIEQRIEHVVDRALGTTSRYGSCTLLVHDIFEAHRCERCLKLRSAHGIVKHADWTALATERRDLVIASPWPWDIDEQGYEPAPEVLVPLAPEAARALYLARHVEIGGTL
jgi:hypothetical protein